MNNFPRDDLTGKEGYGYGGGHQYCGSSVTGHYLYAPRSYLLGGMPIVVLPQSRKETYTGWDDIFGKIFTSGFLLVCFLLIG